MAVKFKNGDVVRQVLPKPIEGKVVRFIFDDTSGSISYLIETTDKDGVHQRTFLADDLELAA